MPPIFLLIKKKHLEILSETGVEINRIFFSSLFIKIFFANKLRFLNEGSKLNTFDLYIMDCALTFENYQHKKALNGGKKPIPDYTQDQLKDMLLKVRNK